MKRIDEFEEAHEGQMFTPGHAKERGPISFEDALWVEIALAEHPVMIDEDGTAHVIDLGDPELSKLARKLWSFRIFPTPESATEQAIRRRNKCSTVTG